MKNEKDARNELDDTRTRLRYGLCALLAVHDAMEYAPNTPEFYIDGLYGVWDYLNRLVKKWMKAWMPFSRKIRRRSRHEC